MQNIDQYDALPVTPSDTVALVRPSRGNVAQDNTNPNFVGVGQINPALKADNNVAYAVSCAVGGTMSFVDKMGNTLSVTLVAGFTYFFRLMQVKATGTTATGIVVYFPIWQ